jgi:phosphoribosylanthranilate isomerase
MFVKICGTTSEEDALLAVAMGADAVGFVFAPSPRLISPTVAGDIAKRLPREILTVGVFRDDAPQRVVEIVNGMGLKAAQLHGRETPEQVQWIRERVPMVIKSFVAGDKTLARAREFGADVLLIDAPSPGSGQVYDWKLAAEAPDGAKVLLAGGLTPENVAEAIAQAQPWGVDVVTGVEASPGRKDPRKLRAFVAAAKGAAAVPYEAQGDGPYDWQVDR